MPRVALFADTFHETNGAANFLRRLVNFAKEKNYELLCVRSGDETRFYQDGSISFLDLKRGFGSIPLDGALKFDPFLWKNKKLVGEILKKFAPKIIHVTGLNDISQFGYYFAHFWKIPAVATWHTNAHEYAAQRFLNFDSVRFSKRERENRQINRKIYLQRFDETLFSRADAARAERRISRRHQMSDQTPVVSARSRR